MCKHYLVLPVILSLLLIYILSITRQNFNKYRKLKNLFKIRKTNLNCRRAWPPGEIHRPIKRLFTPEIKRMLKDWLVRRRENPYPSRDEKKTLANKTGLTYIQVRH